MFVLNPTYSVIPGNFFLKKYFFDIGPLINFDILYNFISSRAFVKLFSMYLFDKLLILEKVFVNL